MNYKTSKNKQTRLRVHFDNDNAMDSMNRQMIASRLYPLRDLLCVREIEDDDSTTSSEDACSNTSRTCDESTTSTSSPSMPLEATQISVTTRTVRNAKGGTTIVCEGNFVTPPSCEDNGCPNNSTLSGAFLRQQQIIDSLLKQHKESVTMGSSSSSIGTITHFHGVIEEAAPPTATKTQTTLDPDFVAAFSPSEMRCLALVSHNGMKASMREFVEKNQNILKKFRLTGTKSTMTMLKDVFRDEQPKVVFGPSCSSGPLGGDAELVALMVGGKIGGIIFFQDPMEAHAHRVDIDCLCRQALVHNTMLAETPTSAMMMLQCLRTALRGKGQPELIPSFFFSLQSPTVRAYKIEQKNIVRAHRKISSSSSLTPTTCNHRRYSTPYPTKIQMQDIGKSLSLLIQEDDDSHDEN